MEYRPLLRQQLETAAESDRTASMAAYMKGHFEFLGVAASERKTASKPWLIAAKSMQPEPLLEMVESRWTEPEREFHYVGTDAIRAGAKNLRATDLDRVHALIVKTPWWDTVDSLAVHTVGPMVRAHSELVAVMDEWIESENIWIARTAILHQLMYKDATIIDRLFNYCEMRMGDTEFFIRKAIGWALRQYSRTNPDAVRIFVAANEGELSGLSKREALKHL